MLWGESLVCGFEAIQTRLWHGNVFVHTAKNVSCCRGNSAARPVLPEINDEKKPKGTSTNWAQAA